jgi:hypothetical protein
VKVYTTINYDQFKTIPGNRGINPAHVKSLVESITQKNLMQFAPIIVNENHEVIDGQHRLEAARQTGIPIEYVIAHDTDLLDVQLLNANSKRWSTTDYLESYINLGNPQYALLKLFMDTYGLPVSISLGILTDSDSKRGMMDFKNGKIVITKLKQGEMIANEYIKVRKYCVAGVDGSRDFIRSVVVLYKNHPEVINELVRKLEHFGKKIERRPSVLDYMRQFEDVLNSHQQKVFYNLT